MLLLPSSRLSYLAYPPSLLCSRAKGGCNSAGALTESDSGQTTVSGYGKLLFVGMSIFVVLFIRAFMLSVVSALNYC